MFLIFCNKRRREERNEEDEDNGRLDLSTQLLALMGCNMFHLSCGFGSGFTATTLDAVRNHFKLTETETSAFVSLLVLGQMVGCLLGGPVSDCFGRRSSLRLAALLSLIGWLMLASATNSALLMTARLISGLADAMGVPVALLMVSETSHIKVRGSFVTSASLCGSLSVTVAYVVGLMMHWRLAALSGAAFPMLALATLFVVQETPSFLVSMNKHEEASEALAFYRKGFDLARRSEELRDISLQLIIEEQKLNKMNEESNEPQADSRLVSTLKLDLMPNWSSNNVRKLSRRTSSEVLSSLASNRRPLIIITVLLCCVPFVGVTSVTFLAVDIFRSVGVSEQWSGLAAVMSSLLRCLGSLLCAFLVDSLGRRRLLLLSCSGLLLSLELLLLGTINEDISPLLMPVALLSLMFFGGLGVCTVPWILLAEWFPVQSRSYVSASGSCAFFAATFVALQVTELVATHFSLLWLFGLCVLVCVMLTLITALFVEETNGRTFDSEAKEALAEAANIVRNNEHNKDNCV